MVLRVVFMGTPDFAVPTLVEIVGRGYEVAAVYTRAPKPAGRRGLDLTPSPVEREAIEPDTTAGDLHDRLARLGADLMVRALGAIERGSLTLTPQPADGVTYAAKIGKEETRITWARPWREVHDHIRGLSPFPGAWFETAGESARVKVLRTTKGEGAGAPGTVLDDKLTVACGDGAVRILELQRAGRQAMKAGEFLRGTPVAAGTRFG
jgi:methionyl-tRNA formyltransferase